MKVQFKSIKTRMTAWFLVVALLPLLIVCAVVYRQRVDAIKAQAFDKLKVIRDLKVGEITFWVDERAGDVQAFSKIAEIENIDAVLSDKDGTAIDTKSFQTLSPLLSSIRESYEDYAEIFVVSGQSGRIAVSTDPSREGKDVSGRKFFTEPLRTGDVYISDIYESRSLNRHTMEFSFPFGQNSNHRKSPDGVLVARIDLERSVYQLLLDQTGLGHTGETLIINRDVIALNTLRWNDGAPLKLKIEAEPAVLAARGKTGIVESLDYRGEKVLAAYTHIPRAEWGFVAKMDQKEIYAPIQSLVVNILILFFVVGVVVCLLALLITRRLTHPILSIAAVAKRVRQGDLSARNNVSLEDEVGYLADSFNQAVASVAFRIDTDKKNTDLVETLILPKELKEFAGVILGKIMEITESQLGAFYLRGAGENQFEPLAAIGANAEMLGTFDADIFEGEFGNALVTGKLSRIEDIPEDTLFKFKTFAGTAIPREMITLPVVVDKEIRAMICIASIGGYSEAALTILSQSAIIALNTALANLLAKDETQKLSEELREINQELQAQQEELEVQAEELRGQNVEIEQQRLTLEEANRMKSQFLSNMSHELRTPLNSVMALSRVLMMQAKAKLSPEEVGYLGIIERNGKNLLNLINDILDLSKIEAGRMDINPKSFSLRMTLENIIESITPIALEKQIEIHQNIPGKLSPLESDEIRVSQILQNLIGNAVKFTSAGSVSVSVLNEMEKISVRIADTGIGIAENDLPYIFDEFRQVDGSSSRRHEGTGLGLAIARKATRMLGGDITVTSVPERGSTFTLTLPVIWKGAAPVYEPIVSSQPSDIKQARKTILVVDDEPEMVSKISRYLYQEGYNTVIATSGSDALKLAALELPFAIMLDIIMPDMDGWEVLQGLKKNPKTKDIPVIIVSISEDRDTGVALGAVGYVTKPVSKKQLISEIQKIGKLETRTIMIVDDNHLERQEIGRIIEEEGLKQIVAEDGAACLELLKKQIPDVLVLDLMMPELDGFAVLERIRNNLETRDLPVIVVTAKDLTEEDRNKLTGNVFSVLEKSTKASATLLAEIKRILVGLENLPISAGAKTLAVAPRILVVDDNESVIIQVKTALESAGYAVDVSRGGQAAFDFVSHTIPDGIILDLMMPEIDGFGVLEKIRGSKATSNIPVLILTAKDLTPEDFKKLSANNVQQLVQKGDVDLDSLLDRVRSMVEVNSRGNFETIRLTPADRNLKHASLQAEHAQPQRTKPATRKPGKASATILVVEDNPDNMTTFKAILQNQYQILEATDGEEGLRIAEKARPDLILLDMALPKIDGFAVVRNLKRNIRAGNIPVIALTAKVMKGDREKILEAGCDDYIAKPIDPESFLEKIDEWVKG